MSSVSNQDGHQQDGVVPSREQCLREAAQVYAAWRAEGQATAVVGLGVAA